MASKKAAPADKRRDEKGRPRYAGAELDTDAPDVWQCRRCGQEYPDEYVEGWGQEGRGDGYGSEPVCTAMREDKNGKEVGGEIPRHVCRGPLTLIGAQP